MTTAVCPRWLPTPGESRHQGPMSLVAVLLCLEKPRTVREASGRHFLVSEKQWALTRSPEFHAPGLNRMQRRHFHGVSSVEGSTVSSCHIETLAAVPDPKHDELTDHHRETQSVAEVISTHTQLVPSFCHCHINCEQSPSPTQDPTAQKESLHMFIQTQKRGLHATRGAR